MFSLLNVSSVARCPKLRVFTGLSVTSSFSFLKLGYLVFLAIVIYEYYRHSVALAASLHVCLDVSAL